MGPDYKNQLTFNQADSSVKQIQLQTERAVSTSSILIGLNDYQRIDQRFNQYTTRILYPGYQGCRKSEYGSE